MRADLSTYAAFCQIAIAGLTMQADELEREARQLEPFVRKNSRAPSLAKRQSDEEARLRMLAKAKRDAVAWWTEKWTEVEKQSA